MVAEVAALVICTREELQRRRAKLAFIPIRACPFGALAAPAAAAGAVIVGEHRETHKKQKS